MQKKITRLETPNGTIDRLYNLNNLAWVLGMMVLIWAIIGGERALVNAAVIIAIVYLIKE